MYNISFKTALVLLGSVLLAWGLCGCSTTSAQISPIPLPMSSLFSLPPMSDEGEADGDEESSALGTVALYIPNRIFDACDMVRAGVNVGPGLGVDVRCTKWAKVQLISDMSLGVGFQSLRHLPVCLRSHTKLGLGFISTPSMNILNWYYGDYDARIELYLFLVGAHVAVDLGEIVDFIGGIFTWDPMEDDFQIDL